LRENTDTIFSQGEEIRLTPAVPMWHTYPHIGFLGGIVNSVVPHHEYRRTTGKYSRQELEKLLEEEGTEREVTPGGITLIPVATETT
jgi:hypothetical protein